MPDNPAFLATAGDEALRKHNAVRLRVPAAFAAAEGMSDLHWQQLKGICPGCTDWWTQQADESFVCDFCGQPVKVKNAKWYASRGDMERHEATREQVEAHLGIRRTKENTNA